MNQYQQDHGNAPEQVKGRFLVFVIILILMFAYLLHIPSVKHSVLSSTVRQM